MAFRFWGFFFLGKRLMGSCLFDGIVCACPIWTEEIGKFYEKAFAQSCPRVINSLYGYLLEFGNCLVGILSPTSIVIAKVGTLAPLLID